MPSSSDNTAPKWEIGNRVTDGRHIGEIVALDLEDESAEIQWAGVRGTVRRQLCNIWKVVTKSLPPTPSQLPTEPWADFGLIHQFAFPYSGGLYLSFQVVMDQQLQIWEMPFTRQTLAGSVFRPASQREIATMKAAGWETLPKWTWIIPQLRYRIFTSSGMIKEMLMMWAMGWEPSEGVKAALAQASQEGTEELDRERKMKEAVTKGGLEAWPPDSGKGWKQ